MSQHKKTALVTGASRGLGLALALALAEKGWQLIINARGADRLEAAQKRLAHFTHVIAIAGDIGSNDHRQALANTADEVGPIDLVINNAGMLGPSPQPNLIDYPLDMLAQVFQTNTIAQLGLLQAVAPYLSPQPTIINVTSDAATEAYAGWGGYGASKAALEQISNILAAEQPAWRVYTVDPGDMQTEMHQAAFPGEDISDRGLPEDSVPGFMALIDRRVFPSGRYAARELNREMEVSG